MRRRVLTATALLALALGTPARAEEPAPPSFSASTTGSPAALAHGEWEIESPSAARLRVEGAAAPTATTSFTARWTSPFQRPSKSAPAFYYEYTINHGRVTTGNTGLQFQYRWRPERGKWSRWSTKDMDLAHEVLTTDGKGGGESAQIVGRKIPRIQWEWKVAGKLVGVDAMQLEVLLRSSGS